MKSLKNYRIFGLTIYLLLHLSLLGLLFIKPSLFSIIFAVFIFSIQMFSISAFYHRCFSHKSFETYSWVKVLFSWIAMSAFQGGPTWWVSIHRKHHAYTEDEIDAHSPITNGFWHSHILWVFDKQNADISQNFVKDLQHSNLKNMGKHHFLSPLSFAFFCLLLGATLSHYAPSLGTNALQLFMWGYLLPSLISNHATNCINSVCHLFGKRSYNTKDESKNNIVLAVLAAGEGWHNNHHHAPKSAKLGFHWYQIDMTYYILKLLSYTGLVWNLKTISKDKI